MLPFRELSQEIGNGFAISNSLKNIRAITFQIHVFGNIGTDRINHIPTTSSITILEASFPQ